jgi:hypothetical protein
MFSHLKLCHMCLQRVFSLPLTNWRKLCDTGFYGFINVFHWKAEESDRKKNFEKWDCKNFINSLFYFFLLEDSSNSSLLPYMTTQFWALTLDREWNYNLIVQDAFYQVSLATLNSQLEIWKFLKIFIKKRQPLDF